jgi:hypothetical protein
MAGCQILQEPLNAIDKQVDQDWAQTGTAALWQYQLDQRTIARE